MGDADSEPERPHSDSARPRGYSEGPIAEAKGRRRAAALQALRSIVQPLPLSRTTGAARSRLSARLGFSTRRFGEAGEASMSDCGSSVGTATDDRRDSELLNYASAPLYQAYSRDDSGSNSPPSARGNGAAAANATAANVTATAAEAGHLRHRPRRSSITVAELRRPSAELLAAAATSPEPQHMQAHTVSEPAAARRTGSIHRQGSFSGMFTAAFGGSSQWKVSPASSPISPPPSPPHLTAARTDLARDADAVLKYGQALRLWARSPYLGATTPRGSVSDATDPAAGRGGYVGTYSKATRVRAVLGRDQLLVVGPVGHIAGEYTELTLLVIDPTGKRGEGQTVRYGDIVCLLDMRGYALNSRTGGRTGYVDIKPRHMKGEMHISFRPGAEYDLDRNSASHRDLLQETSPQPSQLQLLHMGTSAFSGLGSPRSSQHNPSAQGSFESEAVRYGDSNVVAMVEDSSTRMAPNLKLRQHACQPLTIFKKDSSSVAGGYLCCDGKGHTLRFQIHRSKAFIRCVTIYQLEGGSGSKTPYVRQQLHHNVAWDTPITFELPPVQVASAFKQLSQPAVTVTFTNRGCTHISAATLLQVKGVTLLPVEGGSEQGCLRVYIDARPAAAPLPVVETLKESTARLVLWPFTVCGIAVVASNMVASVFPHFLSTRPRVAALVTVLVTAAMLVAWKLMLGGGFGQRRRGSLKATGMLVTLVFQGWEDLVAGDSAADGPNSTRSTEGPGSFNSATESNGDGNIYGPNTLGLGGDFIPEVVPGLPPMPRRFLIAEEGDAKKAAARWITTVEWRQSQDMDNVLAMPHPQFDLIKQFYRFYIHLPDCHGHMVYYEMPGQMNMAALKDYGVEREDLRRHYCYCMEFLWRFLQPREVDKLTIVFDCEGLKVNYQELRGETFSFLKSTVSMLSAHYPNRSFKIVILNAPSAFNLFYGALKSILPQRTRDKISVIPPSQMATELLQIIPPENLPPQYGGTCTIPLGQSPAEVSLRAHVTTELQRTNTDMLPVPPVAV